jgi:hypothetical protein
VRNVLPRLPPFAHSGVSVEESGCRVSSVSAPMPTRPSNYHSPPENSPPFTTSIVSTLSPPLPAAAALSSVVALLGRFAPAITFTMPSLLIAASTTPLPRRC